MAWMLRFVIREAMEFLLRKTLAAVIRGVAANLLPRTAIARL
jgi:hypothetical protein